MKVLDDGDGPRAEAVGVGVRRWCCFCGVRSAASAAAVEEEEEWGIFYGLNRRKSIKKIIELALGGGSGLEWPLSSMQHYIQRFDETKFSSAWRSHWVGT